mmetsp:Transcript_45003/g.71897  ORF Transcript_45003/g.71897 Transcript_45003/m.71897 type:complete len:365 (-) Transcript_45003:2139-3233(-)
MLVVHCRAQYPMDQEPTIDDWRMSRQLSGHSDEVLSVEFCTYDPNLLCSSSADGNCRIWDVRVDRSVKLLAIKQQVNHCVFGNDGGCFVATEQGDLMKFDLAATSVICSHPQVCVNVCQDELNEISPHEDGRHVVVNDDQGGVSLVDMINGNVVSRYSDGHTNICSSVQYCPGQGCDSFTSGGLDSKVISWGPGGASNVRAIEWDTAASSSSPSQMVNPPFVNSIAFSLNSKLRVLGLGDSTLILDVAPTKENWSQICRFPAHRSSVCKVAIPQCDIFDMTQFIYSCGNDRNIAMWVVDIQAMIDTKRKIKSKRRGKKKKQVPPPKQAWSITHPCKPNWLATDTKGNQVAVADVTRNVSIYRVL